MSNHDFGRLATRFGRENARAAALLLLTLPGPAFLYQGDEIGQGDGPPGETRLRPRRARPLPAPDAVGRHAGRRLQRGHAVAPARSTRLSATSRSSAPIPGSMLALIRELIALRRQLGEGFELLDAAPGVLAFRRGGPRGGDQHGRGARGPRRRSSGESRARDARTLRSRRHGLPRSGVVSRLIQSCAAGVGNSTEERRAAPTERHSSDRDAGLVSALAACGSDEGGGGARAINWYVFNEPGGSYDAAVADCNKQAGGKLPRSTT